LSLPRATVLVLATAGAGGDLQPLAAVALELRERGHGVVVLGDASVERALGGSGVEITVSPPELDLGPRLGAAIEEAMERSPADPGPVVRKRMKEWAGDFAPVLDRTIREVGPSAVVTSMFGVEVAHGSVPRAMPWCVVNSTFYVGPGSPRPIEKDCAPRAVPLLQHFGALFGEADLVLHATDPLFDLSFAGLPPRQHYVGPLGIWEPPAPAPDYLDEPGDPWVLVTTSSQRQDDVPLAGAAMEALGGMEVRALITTGGAHDPASLGDAPPNVRLEPYVPHSSVLRRADLLVSHAGHGSVMKALWHGVPMALVPWGRDQPGVAFRAARLGVAEIVERDELSAEKLRQAALAVLADPKYRNAALEHSQRLQLEDPLAKAASLVESLMSMHGRK
jgi:UDP:flavonoid glycosyltransferase YjiC (YdhE family)